MSSRDIARRTRVEITFDGTDITESILPYFTSLTYTDNQEDAADDLQITLQDSDEIWLKEWLSQIIEAAASSGKAQSSSSESASTSWSIGDDVVVSGRPQYSSYGDGKPGATVTNHKGKVTHLNLKSGVPYPIHVDYLGWFSESQVQKTGGSSTSNGQSTESAISELSINALIVRQNWNGDGTDNILDTGAFTLDKVDCSGPPSVVKISATSLPFTSQIRQTKKTKGWEQYYLSGIAKEMASSNGMTCMFLANEDPFYSRVEQYQCSDIEFLKQLCHDAGCSLKATNKSIVIFDQADYESKAAVKTIRKGDGSYTKYKLSMGTADTQYQACRVFYNNPATGSCIEATAYDDSYDSKKSDNQTLEICRRVSSIGEAKSLAEKNLRLHNKYARTIQFTFDGDPAILAGLNINLVSWGSWDGKYIITQAKHTVGSSGYQTTATARAVLEGY